MSSLVRKLLKRVVTSRWITRVVWPIFVTLPPLALAFTQVKGYPILKPYQDTLISWFVAHPLYVPFCFSWTIVLLILNFFFGPLVERARETPDRMNLKMLQYLHKSFGYAVGAKLNTTGCFLRELQDGTIQGKLSTSEWFSRIHDPKAQLVLLVNHLYQLFLTDIRDQMVDKEQDVELKIALARMDNGSIKDFFICAPEDHLPLNTPERINRTENGFHAAVVARQMLIIPDIAKEARRKEKRRYTALGDDPAPVGSMICFPLRHPHLDKIPFVLSIKCNQRNHFTEDFRTGYELLIGYFANRILLEYTLMEIREKIV